MKVRIIYRAIVVLVIILTILNGKTEAENVTAEFLLEQNRARTAKLKNCRCVIEKRITHDVETLLVLQQHIQNSDPKGGSGDFYFDKEDLVKGISYTEKTERSEIFLDEKGRQKIASTGFSVKPQKEKQIIYQEITAWNGERSILFNKMADDRKGGAVISAGKNLQLEFLSPAAQIFGDILSRYMEKAVANNDPIAITEGENHLYKVELPAGTRKVITYVDPAKDYAVARQEIYRNNVQTFDYAVEEYQPINGFWIPIKGEFKSFLEKEPDRLKSRISFVVKQIQINDCTFEDRDFEVPLDEEGTEVCDSINKVMYKVGDPSSYRTIGGGESKSAFSPSKPLSLKDKQLPEMAALHLPVDPNAIGEQAVLLCFCDLNQRPSRHGVEELVKRAEELKGKGVWAAVVQTEPVGQKELEEWRAKYEIPFPVGMIREEGEKVLAGWGVRGQPWLILTDRQQVVRAEGFGVEELDENLKKIIGEEK